MISTKIYLPVIAAFIIGVTGAVGYAVHAQGTAPSTVSTNTPVQTTLQDPNQHDGETADDTAGAAKVTTNAQDPNQLDGETADDASASVSATSDTNEAESGPADTGSDTGEVDTGK
jgi:hypothetical protein